jgi:hypothetical protein
VKLELAVSVPSLTFNVMSAVPACPAAGVTVTVRFAPVPPNAMFPTGTSVVFVEPPLSVRLPGAVSRSPIVKANGPTATPTPVV